MKYPVQITSPTKEPFCDLNIQLINRLHQKGMKFGMYKTDRGYIICRELKKRDEFKKYKKGYIVNVTKEDINGGWLSDNFETINSI